MVFTRVTPPYAPVQYRRPFRLRAGSTAWCVAAVHTGAVSTDRVPLLDGPEPRAHPMDVDPGAESRGRPHRGRRRAVDHTFGRVDAQGGFPSAAPIAREIATRRPRSLVFDVRDL